MKLSDALSKKTLIKQDDDYGCAIAGIAMALKIPYAKAREEAAEYWDAFYPYTPYKGMGHEDEQIILYKHGLKTFAIRLPESLKDREGLKDLIAGIPALFSVPSINVPGLFHSLYWDGENIHDPSRLKTYSQKMAWEAVREIRLICKKSSPEKPLHGISKKDKVDTPHT